MIKVSDVPSAEQCVTRILELSEISVDPEKACDLWAKILQHKWFLSEKIGRDVGIKIACLDFLENVQEMKEARDKSERVRILSELGAQLIDGTVWDTISESQPPKQIVGKRIILPLTKTELAEKHGVTPPKTIIFFGPPGTGKTHFVKAMAGVLKWWYVEISPSDLMSDGADRMGSNLKRLMEKVSYLDEAVVFIDEFEEIAASRDHATRLDKSITNEFLKQVPLLKRRESKMLLICATNYIGELDAALLRPGRFDCVIPVGGLDDQGRRTILEHYLKNMNKGEVDVDLIISKTPFFTPADIEYLFQKVAQLAFEKELSLGRDYKLNTDIFLDTIETVRPTLTPELIEAFRRDSLNYTRY